MSGFSVPSYFVSPTKIVKILSLHSVVDYLECLGTIRCSRRLTGIFESHRAPRESRPDEECRLGESRPPTTTHPPLVGPRGTSDTSSETSQTPSKGPLSEDSKRKEVPSESQIDRSPVKGRLCTIGGQDSLFLPSYFSNPPWDRNLRPLILK